MWRMFSLSLRATASDRLSVGFFSKGLLCCGLVLCVDASTALAQGSSVSVHVDVERVSRHAVTTHGAVWLVPRGPVTPQADMQTMAPQPQNYQLLQKGKEFHPHLLVVPVGSSIDFPNQDPFFHNVFSLFEGKRFDLGLYEAGSRRTVRFDREGVSYIFCNIHPEMGAVIISLRTPYYAMLGQDRTAVIQNVPDGMYVLKVWSEDATAESLLAAERKIEVKAGRLESYSLHLSARPGGTSTHKNKFGEDYPPQSTKTY
jgi:plastocyanin